MGHVDSTVRSARSRMESRAHRRLLIASSTALYLCFAFAAAPSARAQTEVTNFSLPAQSLKSALLAYSAQSKVQVAIPDELVEGKSAPEITGSLSNEQALQRLLGGSGLSYEFVGPRAARLAALQQRSSLLLSPPQRASLRGEQSPALLAVPQPSEEIVVTGTRIRGGSPVGSEAIAIDRKQIELTGAATVSEVLRTLPQNAGLGAGEDHTRQSQGITNNSSGASLNLRGVGADATLTLLNGHRLAPAGQGAFVDVFQIPLAAVEKIDVVLDGASAIYGSDAIGGVVNFILRRNYNGAETSVRNGYADGFSQFSASQVLGTSWATGNAMFSYEYYRRSHLAAAKRDYITDDLRRFGGTDQRIAGGVPGNIVIGTTSYAIPLNANGAPVVASQLVPGTVNLRDSSLGTDIVPDQKRHSFFGSASQDITENLRAVADGLFTRRTAKTRSAAQTSNLSVPSTNAFFLTPVAGTRTEAVQYSFLNDVGPTLATTPNTDYSFTGSLEYDISSTWHASLANTFSADKLHRLTTGQINTALLTPALASNNPATAFNPFGSGFNNPVLLGQLAGFIQQDQSYRVRSTNADINGTLFELPGGTVRIASGSEQRSERFTVSQINGVTVATPSATNSSRSRQLVAFYGEVLAPLIGEKNRFAGAELAELSFALRSERYSDFGWTTNPKVGLRWDPLPGVTVRGSYNTSFKAPRLTQTDETVSTSIGTTTVADPAGVGGRSTIILLSGNNAALQPETSTNWSAGLDFRLPSIPGLRLSGTYYSVDYENRILSLTATDLASVLSRNDIYGEVVTRTPSAALVQSLYDSPKFVVSNAKPPASQVAAVVDGRLRNIGVVNLRGFDFTAAYDFETSVGRFGASANLNWTKTYEVKRSSAAPATNSLGTLGNPLDFKARGGLTWENAGFNAAAFINYTDSYTNPGGITITNVSSWTTVDCQFGWNPERQFDSLRGTRLLVTVQNVGDRKPPFVNNVSNVSSYDYENANALGRVISLSLTKTW